MYVQFWAICYNEDVLEDTGYITIVDSNERILVLCTQNEEGEIVPIPDWDMPYIGYNKEGR